MKENNNFDEFNSSFVSFLLSFLFVLTIYWIFWIFSKKNAQSKKGSKQNLKWIFIKVLKNLGNWKEVDSETCDDENIVSWDKRDYYKRDSWCGKILGI